MSLFSAVVHQIINVTSSVIVAAALHVPLVMSLLLIPSSFPSNFPDINKAPPTVATPKTNDIPTQHYYIDEHPPVPTRLRAGFQATTTSQKEVPKGSFPLVTKDFFREDPKSFSSSGYKNDQTNDVVSFRPSEGLSSQNASFDAYVNDQKVGEVGGLFVTTAGFSPDNKYFAMETRSTCGAGCEYFDFYVFDIQQKTLKNISSENVFFESYSWNVPNSLTLKQYSFSVPTQYRTSPKQIWNYDLVTGEHSLKETLPDAASYANGEPTYAGYVTTDKKSSPDANFTAVTQSDEQGDLGVYIADSNGKKLTPAYCGSFDSWTQDNAKIKVFVPTVCLTASEEGAFYLYTDGRVGTIEGSDFVPSQQ